MKKRLLTPSAGEALTYGMVLLLIPTLTLLLATFTFMLGGTIGVAIFPIATVIAFAVGHLSTHRNSDRPGVLTRYYLYTVLTLITALLTAALIYDHSYDGNTYHQGSIIHMINGWNPIYNPGQPESLWEIHYAKAIEIVAASITVCFHHIECGKAVNLLLMAASIFITAAFLRNTFTHLSSRKVLLYTILLALCPIVIRQAYIYYNDYALYSLLLITIIALITIYRNSNDKRVWVIAIATTLFAAATKFTIAFYIYLAWGVAIVWIFIKGKRQLSYQLALLALILLITGMCVVGYHPYITNTVGWGNPFYPLMGSTVDIMSSNTPEIYLDGNRFTNWVRSLLYNAQGTGIWLPLASDSLHDYYIAYDSRIAGLGPLFVYALITAVALAAWVHLRSHRHLTSQHNGSVYLLLAILLTGGCFIFEQSWWMRYIPFLWAVPVIALLYTEQYHNLTRAQRSLRCGIYTLLLTTQLLFAASTLISGAAYTQRLGGVLHAINSQSKVEVCSMGTIQSINHKMCERGIEFKILKEGEHPSDTTLQLIQLSGKADIYIDKATYSRMQHPDILDFIESRK